MTEQPLEKAGYLTAPDLSFTITHKAMKQAMDRLMDSPPVAGTTDAVGEAILFGYMCSAGGYTHDVAHQLASNHYYRIFCSEGWSEFKQHTGWPGT